MKTEEFGFGSGEFFFGPEFGSRAITEAKGREDAIRRAQALLADGLHYARSRGLKVCVGFEVTGDPTNAEVQERLHARLEALLPRLSHAGLRLALAIRRPGRRIGPGASASRNWA